MDYSGKSKNILDAILKIKQTGGAGYYDMTTRYVDYGKVNNSTFNAFISTHETFHENLNHQTIYGAVLQVYVYLYKNTKDQKYLSTLKSLVDLCRETHEIYATFLGAYLICNAQVVKEWNANELVDNNPEYKKYFEVGEYISSGFYSHLMKNIAVDSILMMVMQTSEVFNQINEKGLKAFSISDIAIDRFPDNLLKSILPHLTKSFWEAISQKLIQKYSNTPEILKFFVEEIPLTQQPAFRDLTLIDQLYDFFYCEVFAVLAKKISISFVPLDSHLEIGQKLFELAYKIVPLKNAIFPLLPFNSSTEERSIIFGRMLENEKLLFASQKIIAVVGLFSEIPMTSWSLFNCGSEDSLHYFIVFRSIEELMEQYDFSEDGKVKLEPYRKTGVYCFRRKIPLQKSNLNIYYVELILIDELKLFQDFIKEVEGVYPVICNSSFYTLKSSTIFPLDDLSKLVKSNLQNTILLNISLISFYKYYSGKINKIEDYKKSKIQYRHIKLTDQTEYDGLVFFDPIKDLFFVAPCSRTASSGFLNYLSTIKESLFIENDHLVNGVNQFRILASLTHVIKEEYIFYLKNVNLT